MDAFVSATEKKKKLIATFYLTYSLRIVNLLSEVRSVR